MREKITRELDKKRRLVQGSTMLDPPVDIILDSPWTCQAPSIIHLSIQSFLTHSPGFERCTPALRISSALRNL